MSNQDASQFFIEPERYELWSEPSFRFDLERRDFFKLLGAGVVVLFSLPAANAFQESGVGRPRGDTVPQDIGAWLHIGEDGRVTVFTGKVEAGQGSRTELTQVVAEELRTGLETIHLVMGDTALTPFDMGTFGSRTTPTMVPQLRKASAAARELLIDLAAERWKSARNSLRADSGKVLDVTGKKSAAYGELTRGQKLIKTIGDTAPTTPPPEWKVEGREVRKISNRSIVTGQHKYPSDQKRPGILMGRVLRAPAYNSTLSTIDTAKAEAIDGVTVVRDGEFVGVAGPDSARAAQALAGIQASWNTPRQPFAGDLFEYLKSNPVQGTGFGGGGHPTRGSIEEGMAAADKKLTATYTVTYIAHAPLEPRAAVAEWSDGKLTVWTGTQRPFGVREELCQTFRLPDDRVRVIMPDMGSGYGGKHSGEVAIEAARLAKAAGKPVKVVWTREEEFAWAYFRPAGVIEVSTGVKNDGKITAWDFHNYNSGAAGIAPAYDIPNLRVEFHATRYPLRQGSYRGLAATANHFARESQMDEIAHAIGMDPLELRLKNLKDERLRAVLEAAAERSGWGKSKSSPERCFGLSCGFEKGGYIATCAEVAVDHRAGKMKLLRVVEAFECGAIINPDNLKNQIEGAIVQGIGGALFEAIDFENGKILNGRFSRYRVPRFSDVPSIEVVMLDRKDLPSAGAGETPIVGLAPAVANAVFNGTGSRLRSLPLTLEPAKT
ncbi:MAG TPA: molybdopterin cofactor-binding domain-containing protein [Acidobacteriota bacterium]|nr:molybdopterin cofactor-binding domain-containing protein [Acidobacteriota bacterium]